MFYIQNLQFSQLLSMSLSRQTAYVQKPHETHGSPLCNNASFDCYRRTAAELQHFEIKQLFLIHPVYIGLKVKNSLLI